MSISTLDTFKTEHPELELVILASPAMVDPFVMGKDKPPSDFLKYVRDPIMKRNHGSVKTGRFNTSREY